MKELTKNINKILSNAKNEIKDLEKSYLSKNLTKEEINKIKLTSIFYQVTLESCLHFENDIESKVRFIYESQLNDNSIYKFNAISSLESTDKNYDKKDNMSEVVVSPAENIVESFEDDGFTLEDSSEENDLFIKINPKIEENIDYIVEE